MRPIANDVLTGDGLGVQMREDSVERQVVERQCLIHGRATLNAEVRQEAT
jgi:hypothetical protein